MSLSPSPSQTTTGKMTTHTMALIAVMTALICILAPLSIPLPVSPVPITLATFILLLTACLLGWKLAAVSCSLYLLLGITGLPVFSAYGSGIGKVIGPTGGYLAGYLPLTIAAGLIFRYIKPSFIKIILLAAATLILLYLPGTAWLAFQTHLSFPQALMMGVIPYIPGDLIKIILSVIIGPSLAKSLKRAGLIH